MFPHRQKHRRQQQDDRIHQSFIIDKHLCAGRKEADVTTKNKMISDKRKRLVRYEDAYWWSVVHHEGPQSPGEPQTQQDVKDIAAYGVRHGHVPHAWRGTGDNVLNWSTCVQPYDNFLFFFYLVELQSDLPCSLEHWSLLPGRLCPWCSRGCLVCSW